MRIAKDNLHLAALLLSLTVLFVVAQVTSTAVMSFRLSLADKEYVRDKPTAYFMPYKGLTIIGHSEGTFSVRSDVGPRPRSVEANWKDSARFFYASGVEIPRTPPCYPNYTSVETIRFVAQEDCRKLPDAGWFQYQHWSKLLPPKSTPTSSTWTYDQIQVPPGAHWAQICSHMRILVYLPIEGTMKKYQSICTPLYKMGVN